MAPATSRSSVSSSSSSTTSSSTPAIFKHPMIQHIHQRLMTYENELQLEKYNILNTLHLKTQQKVSRIYFILIAAFLILNILIYMFGLSFMSHFVGFYPIYWSFKALRTHNKDDDVQWLTYWIVYGFLSTVESVLDKTLFWLPIYFILKIVFLVWCFHPSTRGAFIVYERVVFPIFSKLEQDFNIGGNASSRPSSFSSGSNIPGTAPGGPTGNTNSKQRAAARHVD